MAVTPNPTRSYRTRQPLRVVGEILGWEPHPPRCCKLCATTLTSSSDSALRRSTTEGPRSDEGRRHRTAPTCWACTWTGARRCPPARTRPATCVGAYRGDDRRRIIALT